MHSSDVKEIARLGANLEITAESGMTSVSVRELVGIVTSKGKHITVHASKYHSSSIKEMVELGGDNITIKI